MLRIGIDTGGTYTDFYAVHARRVVTYKVPSDPARPGQALRSGLTAVLDMLSAPQTKTEIVYGSTMATNALLERRGARTAFVTTAGYEDLLQLGRQARPALYTLDPIRPEPLVRRRDTVGVNECVEPDGRVLVELARREADAVAATLAGRGIESVALCLLFSYINPAHEKLLVRACKAHGLRVSSSHTLLPEYREYERAVTTVVNAYLEPVVGPALASLGHGVQVDSFSVLQSNGGRLSLDAAQQEPVRLLLSGPVGGAVGAWHIARRHGKRRALAFDMGGTSTDVSLLDDGPPELMPGKQVGGFPLGVPMLDIHTVGAGGGSIAWCDAGGALRVGPESAGADPGPACLGRGQRVTVTDAHAALGRLRPEHYLGGRLNLDVGRAEQAIAGLAKRLGLDPVATALGVLRVVNASMEQALRVMSVERGVDPRQCSLLCFGGAGGLHAADLVRELQLQGALVPGEASVLSALGMVHAQVQRDYSRTILKRLPLRDYQSLFEPLLRQARRDLRREGHARPQLERWLDVRYVGQSYELRVPWSRHFEADFHALHEQRFGFKALEEPLELVTLRVRAMGSVAPPSIRRPPAPRQRPRSSSQALWFHVQGKAQRLRTRFYRHDQLMKGQRLAGPALVLRDDTTILIPPDFTAHVLNDRAMWLRAKRSGRA